MVWEEHHWKELACGVGIEEIQGAVLAALVHTCGKYFAHGSALFGARCTYALTPLPWWHSRRVMQQQQCVVVYSQQSTKRPARCWPAVHLVAQCCTVNPGFCATALLQHAVANQNENF